MMENILFKVSLFSYKINLRHLKLILALLTLTLLVLGAGAPAVDGGGGYIPPDPK